MLIDTVLLREQRGERLDVHRHATVAYGWARFFRSLAGLFTGRR
jgi:hypothetical protein